MANVYVDESSLQDIADSIRAKNGTQNTYKPGQMADAIMAIPSGGVTPTGTINITANGTYDVTNYASAVVNVPAAEVWAPITAGAYGFSGSTVTYNNGVLSFSSGSTSWGNFAYLTPLIYTYSQLAGKTIRVEFDYTITGSVGSNRGIIFSLSEWSSMTVTNANQRKAFVSLPDCKEASGHFSYVHTLETSIYAGGAHADTNYMGGIIYLAAGSSVQATLTNIKYEYLYS